MTNKITGARILIVEDELIVAKNIETRLKSLGYVVPVIAASGEEAIQGAAETRPDLVLMDIKLQGEIDGVEAAEEIRARFDIPVVYLTGYADEGTLQRAKVTDPFGYILKPFEVNELRSSIEMALHKHKMDKKLKESEARYRAIVEDQTELICRFLPNGALTFVNEAYCGYFGKKPENLVGHSFMSFLPEEDREKVDQHLGSLSPENLVAAIEYRVVDTKGEIRWQQWIYRGIFDGQGGLIEFQSVGRDVTDRKQAEEALRESERNLRQRVDELSTVNRIDRAILSAFDQKTILDMLCTQFIEVCGFRSLMIALVDEKAGVIRVVRSANRYPEKVEYDERLVGLTRDLQGKDILAEVVGTGEMKIIVEWDEDRFATDTVPRGTDLRKAYADKVSYFVPIKARDRVIGVLGTGSPLVEKEEKLERIKGMQPIIDHIALALQHIQMVEVLRETQADLERRNRELTTLNTIAGVVSGSLDVKEVLIRVTEEARAVLDTTRCAVRLVDEDLEHFTEMAQGFRDKPSVASMQKGVLSPLNRRIVRERTPLATCGSEDPQFTPEERQWAEDKGIQATLGVPMVSRDRVLGYLVATEEDRPRKFSPEEVSLCQAIADQVGVAIENAQLYSDTEQKRKEWEGLCHIGQAISASLDLSEILDRIVYEITTTFGLSTVSLALVKEREGVIEIVAAKPEFEVGARRNLSGPDILADIVRTGRMEIIQGWDERMDRDKSILHTAIFIPIKAKGKTLGVIGTGCQPEEEAAMREKIERMAPFLDQAAIAIQNAEWYAELQDSEERFRSLYSSMNEGACLHQIIYDKSGKEVDYRIIDVNPAYESILSIEREKAVGSLASELYGTGEPPYLDVYARVAATQEPTEFETYFPPMSKHFSISVFSPGKGKFAIVFRDLEFS